VLWSAAFSFSFPSVPVPALLRKRGREEGGPGGAQRWMRLRFLGGRLPRPLLFQRLRARFLTNAGLARGWEKASREGGRGGGRV